jgi:hypothetical protein
MAYNEGYTTAEITTSQFVLGIIGILLINLFQKTKNKKTSVTSVKAKYISTNAGRTSLGMTSILLFAVKYIPVSGIVLLMQSVWMGCYSKCS